MTPQTSQPRNVPTIGIPVLCQVQHCTTKNILEAMLLRVDADDHEWETADDGSELSFEWDVIKWKTDDSEWVEITGRK